MLRILLLLSCLLFFVGCSDTAGGSGTETTNGYVALSDGTPAAGAIIKARTSSLWYKSLLESTVTVFDSVICDDKGFYDFGDLLESNVSLEITHGTEALMLSVIPDTTVVLKPSVSISGTVAPTISEVYLSGSDIFTSAKNGTYTLESVPQGDYGLFYKDSSANYAVSQMVQVAGSSTDLDVTLSTGVLFQDFSSGFDRSPLEYVCGGNGWYTFSDSVGLMYEQGEWKQKELSSHNGNTTCTPQVSNGILDFSARLGTKALNIFAGLGVAVWDGKVGGYNLSNMSAIRFRVKGTGVADISLESENLPDTSSQYRVTCTLTTDWKEYTITVDDFHMMDKDSLIEKANPWSSVSKEINRIEFLFQGSKNDAEKDLQLQMDYFYFEGMQLSDFK